MEEKALIKSIIENTKNIAVVGHSANPQKSSYEIAEYLRSVGFNIYPVNPSVETIDGRKSYSNLKEIPEKIDIVQVFRRSEFLPEIVKEAIEVNAGAVWGQFGVESAEAEKIAKEAGIPIVMDRCLKVEYNRNK
jgi:predicted CoA-binding protein